MILYVVEQGSSIHKTGNRLLVRKDGQDLAEAECAHLSAVLMFGRVQVTTQALHLLLRHGIELALFTQNGKLLGQLTPPTAKNLPLRKAQYDKERDPAFALRQAKAVLAAKLHNSREVLKRHALDTPGEQPEAQAAAARISALLPKLHEAVEAASLLGVEGAAAAAYWGAFPTLLKAHGLEFPGRQSHPSPDPINAALSLGYVVLGNLLQSLLDGLGFDPFLGFLHEESYGRASLALDLLEPFRAPVVDRLVVKLFNLKTLQPADFAPDEEGGCRMAPDALRRFFAAWERQLARLKIREAMQEQAEQLARVFRDQEPEVKPWRWEAR